MENFKYKTQSGAEVELAETDMRNISNEYGILCTKEYLIERFGLDEDTGRNMAAEVRRQMDKYGFDEEEAADEIKDDYIPAGKAR